MRGVCLYTASVYMVCLFVWYVCVYGVSMRYATLGHPIGPNKAYIMLGGLRAEVQNMSFFETAKTAKISRNTATSVVHTMMLPTLKFSGKK